MNINALFQFLRLMRGLNEPTDLETWRDWLVNVMLILALFFLPLAMLATFPVFIAQKHYGLIAFDVTIWFFVLFRVFIKGGSYRFRAYVWLAILYTMAITFFVVLGPHHARSGWLVMCSVMAALMFGAHAAAVSTAFNAVVLMVLYWLMGPENQAWAAEYAAPLGKWVMFVINISIITLGSSLSVGFLLNRLNRSLIRERDTRKELSVESEKLQTANTALQGEIEARKRAEEALRNSEARLQSIIRVAPIGIGVVSDRVIQTVNDRFCEMVGFSREELIGQGARVVYPSDEEFERVGSEKYADIRKYGISSIETKFMRKDGQVIDILLRSAALNPNNLSEGVAFTALDFTERKQAEESLLESKEQLRALATRLVEMEEAERKGLAQELHDRVGQNLSALNINLNIMGRQLSAESTGKVAKRLSESMTMVEEATGHIRDVMAELRPHVLDDYGLMAALRWYVERFSERTGVSTEIRGHEPVPRLPQGTETVLFRISQEAMTNVAKHSHASQVTLTLEEVDGLFRLSIADDGVGFDLTNLSSKEGSQWGLIIMKERAQAAGGTLSVESEPGKGTRVVVEVKR